MRSFRGKGVWLLVLISVVQFSYPITQYGPVLNVLYQLIFFSMVLVGVLLARDDPRRLRMLAACGALAVCTGTVYGAFPGEQWALYLGYSGVVPYNLVLLSTLMRFIFRSRAVNLDVVSAACSTYLMLGAVFVPIYGFVETLAPGSFTDNARPGQPVYWQQIIYFSFVALTTMGFGDVAPVSMWARSLATFEGVIGVLYPTVVVARLVGLYAVEAETDVRAGEGEE